MKSHFQFPLLISALIALLLPFSTFAQVITTTPAYPVDGDSVTIFFDAAQGDAGLKDVTGAIYAHTGVITNLSASPSDWKYVVAGWTENTPKAQLTSLGNNKFKLTIKPSIRAYYNVPAAEVIEKLAFVFRNADGTKTGRNADGSDIFADVYPNVMSVNIVLPAQKDLFLKLNDPIPISAISPLAQSMKLFLNNVLVKTAVGQTITDTIAANNFGQNWVKNWVRVEAINSTTSVADSFSYTVFPNPDIAALPAGIVEGITYNSATSATLCLYAPGKTTVFALGDFNNWQLSADHYMKITPDGNYFWLEINNLIPKEEYIFQYLVDATLRIGDPYADKVSDPDDKYISPSTYPNLKPYPTGKTSGIATYLQTNQDPFVWTALPFTPPAVTDLVIYELLIRDFTLAHDYPSLIDTLDYLKRLGVNAIELMPVMEFEGNVSWGYNPNYSFAVDKYYGTKNGLKQFIDVCHANGIAVILDIVCNHHFGSSPLARLYWDGANQRPASNNPWFNVTPKHPYNVGNDFNHESPATKKYMERLIRYWLTEFHIDGYRFDLSKGLTQKNSYPDNVSLWGQYDAARIDILKNYTNVMHAVNPKSYAIMEHFADNTEEKVLAAANMLPWGNMTYNYQEGAMGYYNKSDISWASYKERGWSQPNLVAYMESHDEERMMFKNIAYGSTSEPSYKIKDTLIALKRTELAATFFFTIPGPKMIWQFGEVGYDYSIDYGGGRLAPKPIRWDYQNDWRRRYTRNIFSTLTNLKKTQPVFATTDFSMSVGSAIKRIWLNHSTMDAIVLGNFDVIYRYVTPDFQKNGKWYEFFTGDSLDVQDPAVQLTFAPGEYRIYTTKKLAKPIFTGIGDNDPAKSGGNSGMIIYPNPSDGQFQVTLNLPVAQTLMNIELYTIQGKSVGSISKKNLKQGFNQFSLQLSDFLIPDLRSGIYIVKVSGQNFIETGKVVVR